MTYRKYRNIRTRCSQGKTHASKLEAHRCTELHLLQQCGQISDLEAHPQPKYSLDVQGMHVAQYWPDFRYTDKHGEVVVEDAKGVRTKEYQIKKALMLACHGIEVQEVRSRR